MSEELTAAIAELDRYLNETHINVDYQVLARIRAVVDASKPDAPASFKELYGSAIRESANILRLRSHDAEDPNDEILRLIAVRLSDTAKRARKVYTAGHKQRRNHDV